uniref:YopX family protein n=1 Tax=Helicobacter bilis TaxID=37372 RepID=UPI001F1E1F72
RLWHKPSKSFVEIKSAFITTNGKDEIVFDRAYNVPIDDESVEIELWSGLCDKKGKRIYEGDIVCFKNRGKYNDDRDEVLAKHIKEKCLKKTFLTQIFFKNEGGGYCIKRQTKRGRTKYFSLFDMSFYLNFRLEVVGNIHENADLLEKDKE